MEPGQSGQQVNACEELHEALHPKTPQSQGAVYFGARLWETKQGLSTPDEVAGAQAKKNQWRPARRENLQT
jgi:hypothetical protein